MSHDRGTTRHDQHRPRVVIVGGGFGGLHVARGLARSPVDVVLFDRHNYHLFQPLLYQVASAALSPADIAQPIRKILSRQNNCRVVLNTVDGVDLERRVVRYAGGETAYDFCVLATGATHSYFGHPEWAEHAPGLKTIDDALEIRRRMLLAFEEAEQEADAASRAAKLTFVVVGAGPTGVELAGALKEIAARTIPRDFRNIDTTATRVILIEGANRVLPAMAPASSQAAGASLEQLGVEVRTGSPVTGVSEDGVHVGDTFVAAASVFWAAGVQASSLARNLGVDLDRHGRVPVADNLSLPGHPEVFVIGDLAAAADARTGEPLPGVAQVAIQGGDHVAREIAHAVDGRRVRQPFHYRDLGTLATIGRRQAVAEVFGRRFHGFVAWLLWSAVHIVSLVTFRAKVFVLASWIWNYLFASKGARLITGSPRLRLARVRSDDPTDEASSRERAERG